MFEPPKPITIKERFSLLFLERGNLDVIDGAFVVVDKTGVRTQIPVGGVCCLMLEPGIRVSHATVALAARVGCLLVWVGEAAVRHVPHARGDEPLSRSFASFRSYYWEQKNI
ncbi:MAG: hypothetical protein A3G34_13535 [Candidatus Lindowbacteria bacterium RIFCSPLOWO2_12_FULL_62_27]|nr:MAG: hypothetical protein A3I06_10915 [Candidatus Lindowbacteria bacterium RIFCSPLOWO2_02_FULL_62_12]OGH62604.1 MAG: hypothetical protein A3G34_13535 [Candidatus Lindowbacteria bacterium RIFCSPLOWO2_12_FULL_62_27]